MKKITERFLSSSELDIMGGITVSSYTLRLLVGLKGIAKALAQKT